MNKLFNIFAIIVFVLTANSLEARTKVRKIQTSPLTMTSTSVDIWNLLPGEPGNKLLEAYIRLNLLPVLKHQGVKAIQCLSRTDAIACGGFRKGSWRDRRCQAALAKSRCRVIGNVLEPLGITVKPIEGGEERKIEDGKFRGVSLRWKNAYCSQEEIDNAEEIRRELDRSVLSSSQVSEVPAKINLRRQSPELVVLVTGILVSRDGSKSGGGRKTCLALVNVGKGPSVVVVPPVIKVIEKKGDTICPEGSHKQGKSCVCNLCPAGTERKMKGGKACGICVPRSKSPVVVTPVCGEDQRLVDGKCVDKEKSLPLTFGLAAGIGKLSFCPELVGDPIQVSLEGQGGIGSVIGGVQTASMVTGVNPSTGAVTASMKHGPLYMLGVEGFVSLARIGLKDMSLGVRASLLGNMDVQYPAIGGFVAYKLTEQFSIKAFAQKLLFEKLAANDLMADPESSSTWLFGVQAVYSF